MRRTFLVSAMLVAMAVTPAWAQNGLQAGNIRLGGSAALSFPSEDADGANTNLTISGGLGYLVTDWLDIGVSPTFMTNFDTDAARRSGGVFLEPTFYLVPGQAVTPYLFAGGGFQISSSEGTSASTGGSGKTDTSTDGSITGGGGMLWFLTEAASLDLRYRYFAITDEIDLGTNTFSIGFQYFFSPFNS